VANTHWQRLIGLLGKTRNWARPGRGLWIRPSHGVHTIGIVAEGHTSNIPYFSNLRSLQKILEEAGKRFR